MTFSCSSPCLLRNRSVKEGGGGNKSWGSFKNYVDKMRWEGGQKLIIFVHVQVKNVHVEVGR